jgi:hypothetical protein
MHEVVPVLINAIGSKAPCILNLSNERSRVVIFMLWSLYPLGKRPLNSLDRRLDGPQSWSERGGEKKKMSPRNRTLTFQPVASHFTD